MATQQINNIKDQLLQIIELSESSSEIINDLDNNNINSKIKEICVLICNQSIILRTDITNEKYKKLAYLLDISSRFFTMILELSMKNHCISDMDKLLSNYDKNITYTITLFD